MSEHISRCYRCLAPNPAWGMTICAACRQVEALEKQTEAANSRAEREAEMYAEQSAANARRLEDQNRESMRIAENNARLARQQAKENARLAAESGVSYDDAYQYGLHYLEGTIGSHEFLGTYYPNITQSLKEDGTIYCARTALWDPYKMEHLNQAFDRGLKESIKDIVGPGSEYMKKAAYSAGRNLQAKFSLDTSVTISSGETKIVYTREYDSEVWTYIDTDTGEMKCKWKGEPFNSKELNQEYIAGISDYLAEQNTDEKVRHRLEIEVPVILANQARAAEEQRVAEENARIQQEINYAENQKRIAKDESEKNIRKVIAGVIILAIVGFVVGLWMAGHPVFSVLAAFVVISGFISGGIDVVIDFVNG